MPSTSGSYAELYRKYEEMKAAGKNAGNSKSAAKLLRAIQSRPEHQIVKNLVKAVVELDRQVDELTPYLSISDEEKEAIMQKAIEQIEPWYQERVGDIEKSVEEGRVRTAEDTLLLIRQTEQEISQMMSQFDLAQAETEEEFIDKIAALTSTTEDTLQAKRLDWQQRLENVKLDQIQSGIFSSGIGRKRRELEEQMRETELGSVERRAEEQRIGLERERTYDLQQIQLARQSAEQDRIRRIGTTEESAAKVAEARGTLGLEPGEAVGSELDIAQRRTERGVSPLYGEQANLTLRDLQEQRGTRVLSRAGELEAGELSRREAEYGATIDKILAEQAKKKKALVGYGLKQYA